MLLICSPESTVRISAWTPTLLTEILSSLVQTLLSAAEVVPYLRVEHDSKPPHLFRQSPNLK
jgi:hypothetical protein